MRTDLTQIANSLFIRADEGDLDAQKKLLTAYREGLHSERNPRQNFQYFLDQTKKSENIFHFSTRIIYPQEYERTSYAMMRLGDFYLHGIDGIEVDQVRAFNCYQKAANQGNIIAKIKTALCLSRGIGVEKNNAEAYKILHQCPLIPDVEFNLGKCYDLGIGTEKDKVFAFLLVDSAALKGHAGAQQLMAEMLARKDEMGRNVRYQKFSLEISQELLSKDRKSEEVPEFVAIENPILKNLEMIYVSRGEFSDLEQEYRAASVVQGLPFFPSKSPKKSVVELVKPKVAALEID